MATEHVYLLLDTDSIENSQAINAHVFVGKRDNLTGKLTAVNKTSFCEKVTRERRVNPKLTETSAHGFCKKAIQKHFDSDDGVDICGICMARFFADNDTPLP